MGNSFEPALVSAVRHFCCSDVLKLLMSHGDDYCTDSMGRTALTLLCATRARSQIDAYNTLDIAATLISAGIDPGSPDGAHRIPVNVARESGDHKLAKYLDVVLDVWACTALQHGEMTWRKTNQNHNDCSCGAHIFVLSTHLLNEIFSFVLPADVIDGLRHMKGNQENVVSLLWS